MSEASLASESRFQRFVDGLASVIGHKDRAGPLRAYSTALMMPCARKSVEPLAKVTAPGRVAAQHQSLLHFIGEAAWSDEAVLAQVRAQALPAITRGGPIEAWIIDDTGFPKKGQHSVGVARQYCGQLGKKDNCQVAVSLSVANHDASLPVAYRLYLPKDWAKDKARRTKAKVPKAIKFKTKPAIALEQIGAACASGLPRGVVLMDAAYGNDTHLRSEIGKRGLEYIAAVLPNTSVWAPGTSPLPPGPWAGTGRVPKRIRRDATHRPVSVKALAASLPKSAWKTIKWREGSNGKMESRFARVRVRPAHRDNKMTATRPEEWLLAEWPEGEPAPTKFWLATVPETMPLNQMVDLTKLRWRIERDYHDLKQEVGLGHYEGRGWRGFHHHATLCIAAYGFLISERETIPPSAPRRAGWLTPPELPEGYRPRGAPDPSGAARTQLDRDNASNADRRPRKNPAAMSVLRHTTREKRSA
jgi:SRSO17 transposase